MCTLTYTYLEQYLPPYNNCLLGAIVLSKYVQNPWTPKATFKIDLFLEDINRAVRALNVFSDINENLHPLKEQRDADKFGKRIGLEFTALADTMAMLGIKYGSYESMLWVRDIMHMKAAREIQTSCEIAKEQGPCPALEDKEARIRFLESPYIKKLTLSQWLKDDIMEYGLRNTAFNTVGPTGSISIISGNCSSGIEPIFAMSYNRETRLSDKPFEFIHKPALEWVRDNGFDGTVEELKERLNYVESHEIPWKARIELQAAVQKYTDSSISSTVNLPETATVEEILDIYMYAAEKGLKGVTIFRNNCKKGVLSTGSEPSPKLQEQPGEIYVRELLDVEQAERHRVNWRGAKMYVIVSLEDDTPVEVFVKLPREAGINGTGLYREELYQEKFSLWETITRLASLLLRSGMPLKLVIKQLEKGSYAMTDAGSVLARILRKYEYKTLELEQEETGIGEECPECGKNTYMYQSGCPTCSSCGYSNCG